MTCPICDQKTINCDCIETERRPAGTDEPVAWGVLRVGGRFGYASVDREEAVEMQARLERMENWKYEVVPLYAHYPRAVRLPKLLEKMHGETDYGKGYNTALRTCQEILSNSGVMCRSRSPEDAKNQEHRMTDETTPQDGKAMSPASAGSVDRALQPAVWAILSENGQYRLPEIAGGAKVCRFYGNDRYVPLYAEEAMKRVARIANMSVEWIQVSERLPEDGTWCWVDWDGPGKPFPAMRDSRSAGGWTNTDCWEDFDIKVTRWMPLPEPPTGASDTERAGSTAADEIERLRAEIDVLKESAYKLHDIAASGAEPTTRRRMLDQMAEESFAEYG